MEYEKIYQLFTDRKTKEKYALATYKDFICLDIETSHKEVDGETITWMTSSQMLFRDEYYLDRKPSDLMARYQELIDRLELTSEDRVVTYIHNASYDLSYLIPFFRKYITKYSDGTDIEENYAESIILASNKILVWTYGCFVFRCSYRLASCSLEKWSKELDIEHKKLVGLYDYSKVIYQDDELTEDEQDYDKYDVLAMRECIATLMERGGYDIVTIPLTSTQFVRKELAASCKKDKDYKKKYFNKMKLSVEDYEGCLLAYSGGYTHGNRFWMNRLLEVGKTYKYRDHEITINAINHRDFKSDYPTQMTCYEFPIEGFTTVYEDSWAKKPPTIDDILALAPKYATLTTLVIAEIDLKDEAISMPFAQDAKFLEQFGKASSFKTVKDNGRILHGSGRAILRIGDKTLRILNEQYNMKYHVVTVKKAKYGRLPKCIVNVVDKHFAGKTNYKAKEQQLLASGLPKEDPRVKEAAFNKMQSKKQVNGLYGCAATKPLRESFCINGVMEYDIWRSFTSLDPKEDFQLKAAGLAEYYKAYSSFLPYQWGVWITENARWELYEYMKVIGYDYLLYADTDSLFYISTPEIEERIEALNQKKAETAHYVVLDNGQQEFYDAFCLEEDCPIKAFKGLHSKCYGVVNNQGHLDITIAGVPSETLIAMVDGKPIYYTREQELAGVDLDYYKEEEYKGKSNSDAIVASIKDPYKALDNLKDGFAFHTCTGTTAQYVGALGLHDVKEPQIVMVDGHEIETAGGCVINELDEKVITYHDDMFAYSKQDD